MNMNFCKSTASQKIGGGIYKIRSSNNSTYIEWVPETEIFLIYGKLHTDLLCICLLLQKSNVVFKKSLEDLEGLNELASLQNQSKELRLHDELGKRNFYEEMQKYLETLLK